MARDNYTTGNATLIFKGLTLEQAKGLAEWFEGQGEQQTDEWLAVNGGIPSPLTDVSRDGGYCEVDEKKQIVTVFCHTPPIK